MNSHEVHLTSAPLTAESRAEAYRALLEHSYEQSAYGDPNVSRLEYLSEYIFDFTTYDTAIGELFAHLKVTFMRFLRRIDLGIDNLVVRHGSPLVCGKGNGQPEGRPFQV